MFTIRFFPESDSHDYRRACEEYEAIWREDGERIVAQLEHVTGLHLRGSEINAIVWSGVSRSYPLLLRSDLDTLLKRSFLIHELGHRLIDGVIWPDTKPPELESHKMLYLILPEVLLAIGGQKLLDVARSFERALPPLYYKEAWDYALAFTPEERMQEFKKAIS